MKFKKIIFISCLTFFVFFVINKFLQKENEFRKLEKKIIFYSKKVSFNENFKFSLILKNNGPDKVKIKLFNNIIEMIHFEYLFFCDEIEINRIYFEPSWKGGSMEFTLNPNDSLKYDLNMKLLLTFDNNANIHLENLSQEEDIFSKELCLSNLKFKIDGTWLKSEEDIVFEDLAYGGFLSKEIIVDTVGGRVSERLLKLKVQENKEVEE